MTATTPDLHVPPHRDPRWFTLAMLALTFVAGAHSMSRTVFIDDAFIFLRTARNLANGDGMVFNPGEWVCGCTSVLYTWLLAALHNLTRFDLTTLAAALHLVLVPVIGLQVRGLLRNVPGGELGWLVPVFVASRQFVHVTLGMESLLLMSVSIAAIDSWHRARPWRLGVFAAATCLCRPDHVVLAAILFVAAGFPRQAGGRWRMPWRVLAGGALASAPWTVYALWHFGSIVPATVEAKMLQGQSGLWDTYARELWTKAIPLNLGWWSLLVIAGILAAAVRRSRLDVLLLAWTLAHSGLFSITGVPSYLQYYAPFLLQSALLGTGGIAPLAGRSARSSRLTALAAAAVAIAVTWPSGALLPSLAPDDLAPKQDRYYLFGTWLRQHAPPGSSLGSLEIGILGYYSELRVVDFCGLVTPGIAARLRDRQNAVVAMQQYRPDFVIARPAGDSNMETGLLELLRTDHCLLRTLADCSLYRRVDTSEQAIWSQLEPLLAGRQGERVLVRDLPPALTPAALAARFPGLAFTADANEAGLGGVVFRRADGTLARADAAAMAPLRFPVEELDRWKRERIDDAQLADGALRLVAKESLPTLSQQLAVTGPFARVRVRIRQYADAPPPGPTAFLWWTSTSNTDPSTKHAVAGTITAGTGSSEVVFELPRRRFLEDEVLHELHLGLSAGPCVVGVEALTLERW
ncbi:MAG TPA: hypothetical protein VF384_15960 [Planctomycetota bacterium]